MPRLRRRDHVRAEINAHSAGWLDGGEEIAEAASQFEDAHVWRDEEAEIALEQPMIIAREFTRAAWGARVVECFPIIHRTRFKGSRVVAFRKGRRDAGSFIQWPQRVTD